MYDHAPISNHRKSQRHESGRKEGAVPWRFFTDVGVRELHLLEKTSGEGSRNRFFWRSWDSTRATFRPEVSVEDPVQVSPIQIAK